MDTCKLSLVVVIVIFLLLAFVYMQQTKQLDDEDFYIGNSYIRNTAPYYTTTFQAYPGKYMSYGSNRNSYCLQQHQDYSGYRNCMLYLE